MKNKLFYLYLALISTLSVIALAINIGIILSTLGNYYFITDNEYAENHYSEKPIIELSKERKYILKKDMINSVSWLLVFSFLFVAHFNGFKKTED